MFLRQLLAGGGRSRNHHSIPWKTPAQFSNQFTDRKHLADRNRVNPDRRTGLRLQPRRYFAKALAKTLAVLALASPPKHPIGQADQQACGQQRAVKQVHEERSRKETF